MLRVYLNYPVSRISVHADPDCTYFARINPDAGRMVRINPATISAELQRFINKEHTFRSEAGFNDLRLEIDFGDLKFEREILSYIHRLLGKHYRPFKKASIDLHCR